MNFEEYKSIVLAWFCVVIAADVIRSAWQANVPPESVGKWLDFPELFS